MLAMRLMMEPSHSSPSYANVYVYLTLRQGGRSGARPDSCLAHTHVKDARRAPLATMEEASSVAMCHAVPAKDRGSAACVNHAGDEVTLLIRARAVLCGHKEEVSGSGECVVGQGCPRVASLDRADHVPDRYAAVRRRSRAARSRVQWSGRGPLTSTSAPRTP